MTTKQKYNLEKMIKGFKKIWYQNPDFNSKNFPVPKVVKTKGFKVIQMDKSFTSQEALDRIQSEGCRPVNAYELLLWSKENQKEGTWALAFGQTWTDSVGRHRVPCVRRVSDGGFEFALGYFVRGWADDVCLVCFCDSPSDTQNLSVPSTESLRSLKILEDKLSRIKEIIEE